MTTFAEHQRHTFGSGLESYTIFHLRPEGNPELGAVEIAVCEECAYIRVACEHEKRTWSEDGTVLRCDLCGKDVT